MTLKSFTEFQVLLEGHYRTTKETAWQPYHADMIERYIARSGLSLDEAAEKIMMSHPQNFGIPGIAEFQKAFSAVLDSRLDAEANAAWSKVTRNVNYYKSITFEDPRICAAFEAIGGISGYSTRAIEYKPLMQKDFILAFKRADSLKGNLPLIEFHGNCDNADLHMIYVGNEERIRIALNVQKTQRPAIGAMYDVSQKLQVKFSHDDINQIRNDAEGLEACN